MPPEFLCAGSILQTKTKINLGRMDLRKASDEVPHLLLSLDSRSESTLRPKLVMRKKTRILFAFCPSLKARSASRVS